MTFNLKTSILLLLLGSTAAGIAGSKGHEPSVQNYKEETEESLQEKIEKLTQFLSISNSNKDLKEVIKEYALTLTGARDLSYILSNSLILNFIDHDNSVSLLKTKIKGKLDAIRLNTLATKDEKEKEKIYKRYGGEDRFKTYHSLKGIRKIFIDELTAYLPTILENASNDLKGVDSSDDLIKNKLGKFYDKLLDDYISHNKPVFVESWFFAYTDEPVEDKIQKLFSKSNAIPSGYQFPSKASYFFPYLKDKSAWDTFKGDTSYKNPHSKLVIPLSIIDDQTYSSQYLMSVLQLRTDLSKATTTKDNLKTLEDIDSSEKSNELHEFDAVKSDDAVFFRDSKGFHVLRWDQTIKANKDKSDELKKELIKAAKNKDEKSYRFDLADELKKWLEKHLDRILLGSWTDIEPQDTDWKDCVTELVKVLESISHKETVFELRKHVLRDYAKAINTYTPIKVSNQNDDKTYINPMLTFAGKPPNIIYEDRTDATKELDKLDDKKLAFTKLETVLLSKLDSSGSNVSLSDLYSKTLKDTYQEFKTKWENVFTNKSNDLELNNEQQQELLYEFKSQTSSANPTNLSITNFFNNLWTYLLFDGKLKDYLIQDNLRTFAASKFKDTSSSTSTPQKITDILKKDTFSKNESINSIQKTNFKDSSKDFHEILYRRYLIQKILTDTRGAPDISIYDENLSTQIFDISKLNDIDQSLEFLNKIYGHREQDLLSKYQKDIIPELITLDFLVKDNFKAYRQLIRSRLTKGSTYFYVFHKKFMKDDYCRPDVSKLNEALNWDEKKSWSIKNAWLGTKDGLGSSTEIDSTKYTFDNCLYPEDLMDFVLMPENKTQVAYRGFMPVEKLSNILPKELAEEAKKLPPWGSLEDLSSNIKDMITEESLKSLLDQLKESFPRVDWSFPSLTTDLGSNSQLTIGERRNILLGFINQNDSHITNASWDYKKNLQSKFKTNPALNNANSFLKDSFPQQNSFLEFNGSKIFEDSEGNKHLTQLIQLRPYSLSSEETWISFLKTISPDLLCTELVKASMDKELQQAVIHHLLNEVEDGKGINKLKIGDSRLRSQVGISWSSQ